MKFTIETSRSNREDQMSDGSEYWVATCIETGNVTTADDEVKAADMMLEILRDELKFAAEHNNVPNLFVGNLEAGNCFKKLI
jgi:hypothetical protein